MNLTPEQNARLDIDAALVAAGWILQNRDASSLAAGCGSYSQHNTVVHKEVGRPLLRYPPSQHNSDEPSRYRSRWLHGPQKGDGAGRSRRTAELGDHPRRDPQRGPRLQTGAGAGAGW